SGSIPTPSTRSGSRRPGSAAGSSPRSGRRSGLRTCRSSSSSTVRAESWPGTGRRSIPTGPSSATRSARPASSSPSASAERRSATAPGAERGPAPRDGGRGDGQADREHRRMEEAELADDRQLDGDPDHHRATDRERQERRDAGVPQAERRDGERADAEQAAEDDPGEEEVGERAALEHGRGPLHRAAIRRRDEEGSAAHGGDAKEREARRRGLAPSIEARAR